jgi:tetratricopeptide (TPR) repeat protein
VLIGREAELGSLGRAIDDGARIVCVKGPAGVGKTALARALVARRKGTAADDAGEGVVVSLVEGARSEGSLVTAIAAALRVPLPAGDDRAREDRMVYAMAARAPLAIVLNGAERSVSVVEAAVERWAAATPPGVTFVITSQHRLGLLDGPHVFAIDLAPLPLPDARVVEKSAALASPAVRLFVDLAAARAGFELADDDVPDVVALVRALDGLPLALVLGAVRVGLLGPRKMRELLARRFELLVGVGDRRAGDELRHQSLETAIACSWELLAAAEQTTLAAVSVFRGGFTLDGAQAVSLARAAARCEGGDAASEAADAIDTLARIEALLGASLLVLAAPPSAGQGARFDVYESVRDFATRAAPADAIADAERRHASFYVEAAERAADRVRTGDGVAARRWLSEERANVVAASERSERLAPELALRAALALEPLYLARGPVDEHVERVERRLSAMSGEAPEGGDLSHARVDTAEGGARGEVLRARAIGSIGLAEIYAGRRPEGVAHLERALAVAERCGAQAIAARVATKAALVLGLTGESERAADLFERAARHAEAAADPHAIGMVAKDRGMVLAESGDNDAAIAMFDAALAAFRAAGDPREEAFTLAAIGARYLDQGALVEAKRHSRRALAMLEAIGDQRTEAWTLLLLATASLEEGDADGASRHAERALAIVQTVGDRLTEGLALAVLGHASFEAGRLHVASEHYQRATERLEGASDFRNAAIVLGARASVSALLGEPAHAERLLARAVDHARARGRPGDVEAVALFGAVLRARQAEDAAARGDAALARRALEDVDAVIERVDRPESLVHRSDEVRLALRVARRAKRDAVPRIASMEDATDARDAPGASDANPSRDARDPRELEAREAPLVLSEDGAWLRLPSGQVHKLRARPVAARLLRVLVDRALESPGAPVAAAALIAAGWPGEKILPKAAQNRLYVSMTRIRQLGLGDLLQNDGDGYFLQSNLRVRIARERS